MDSSGLQTQAVSVLVPAFDEEEGIEGVLGQLQAVLRSDPARTFEIIVIDDGSADATAERVRKHPDVKLVQHSVNRGYGAALKTGIRHARHDWICITDADGTYPNEEIPRLLSAASEDCAMVVGARTAPDAQMSTLRSIPKAVLRRYAEWIARERIPDLNSGLRVFRRDIVLHFLKVLPEGFSFTTTLTLAMLTNHHRVAFLPIGYSERIGTSKIRPIRDTLNFLLLIVRMGTFFAPFRVFIPLALGLLGLSIASMTYDSLVLKNLTDKTIILLTASLNVGMFGLLADAIQRRIGE